MKHLCKRLVVAQGPMQILCAIAVLRFQESVCTNQDCEDVLLIGNFFTESNESVTQSMIDSCFQIAQIWPFQAMHSFREIEISFYRSEITFEAAVEQLKHCLGIEQFDEVYATRNWQFMNEVCLSAYTNAHKVCYGDGLGICDLNSPIGIQYATNPSGLIQMDEACLLQPGVEIIERIWEKLPIRFVDFKFLEELIYDSSKCISGLSQYCEELRQLPSEHLIFVLLGNSTESQTTADIDAEINLYLSCILPCIEQNSTLLIKRHPRQTLNQSKYLTKALESYGYQTFEIDQFIQIPIELFAPFISIKSVVSIFSSSCVTLAYLCQAELLVGIGERNAQRYINPNRHKDIEHCQKLYIHLSQQAYTKQFHPIRFSDRHQLIEYYPTYSYPVRLSSVNSNGPVEVMNANAELRLQAIDLRQTRIELQQEQVRHQLTQNQLEILQNQSQNLQAQLQQFRSTLNQLQLDLQQSDQCRQQLQKELVQLNTRYIELETKFRQLKQRTHRRQQRLTEQLQGAQATIAAMESSKFWKLRNYWLRLKLKLQQIATLWRNQPLGEQRQSLTAVSGVLSPLAQTDQVTLLGVLESQKVIEAWQNSLQIDIASELDQQKEFYLYQCNQTKLKFFRPDSIAGSEYLYQQLEKFDWYYMTDKWEYEVAIKDLSGCQRVLEVGAGRGNFVQRLCGELQIDALGIELNSRAIEIAQQENIPVLGLDLADVVKDYSNHFDAVCAFQVLEHLPDPKAFLVDILKLLKPNGKLILSVPNAEAFPKYLGQDHLLDYPPHHMTQWSIKTFESLTKILPLKLEQSRFEPLAEYHVDFYIFVLKSRLSNSWFSKYKFVEQKLTQSIDWLQHLLKQYSTTRHFIKGHTLYVCFRKQ